MNDLGVAVNNFEKQDYCVYGYWIDGVCRYIGQGTQVYKRHEDKGSRSAECLELMNNPDMQTKFFAENLTKKEATELENKLLDIHFGKPSDEFQLVNKTGSRSPRTIYWQDFDGIIYYDETSPTFLRWAKDIVDSKGRLTRSRKGVVAGYIPKNPIGCPQIRIDDVLHAIHRLVFSITNKAEVSEDLVINHIDSDRHNNNKSNLEITTQKDNSRKAKMKNTNTSGINGVCKIPVKGGWRARWRDEEGKCRSKEFHLNKFSGTEEEKDKQSFEAACAYRLMIEREIYKFKKD